MAQDTVEYYKDAKSEWRWRRKASNGNIVGSSSEGYTSKQDCVDNFKRQQTPAVEATH
ncbi:MAG TPA: DUF1508 domain-containing protein [bacterium]|jgi:uncharacterized protein YegP (UPF0339 family)